MRSAFALCLVGLAIHAPGRFRRLIAPSALAIVSPLLAAAGLSAGLTWRSSRRLRARREAEQRTADELPLVGDLVGLGLSAGLSFTESLRLCGPYLRSGLAADVDDVVRRTTRIGNAAILEVSGDNRLGRLCRVAGRALTTGAPLAPAVQAFTDELRAERRTARLAAARRLPVVLMFPLALLILPGFVVLTVAPAMVGALERFSL